MNFNNAKTIRKKMTLVSFIILIFSGCVSSPTSFQTPAEGTYEVIGTSKGRAGGVLLFNFIPIAYGSRVDRATKNAVEKLGGDDIIDVTIRDKWWWAGVVFGNVASVEGKVIRYIDKKHKQTNDDEVKPSAVCASVGGRWSENKCVFDGDHN